MAALNETGRFIPVSPGWVVIRCHAESDRFPHGHYWQDDLVGWMLVTLEKETFYLPCIWSGVALEPLNPNDKDLDHYFIDVVRQTADFDVVDLRPAGFFGQRVPD